MPDAMKTNSVRLTNFEKPAPWSEFLATASAPPSLIAAWAVAHFSWRLPAYVDVMWPDRDGHFTFLVSITSNGSLISQQYRLSPEEPLVVVGPSPPEE